MILTGYCCPKFTRMFCAYWKVQCSVFLFVFNHLFFFYYYYFSNGELQTDENF